VANRRYRGGMPFECNAAFLREAGDAGVKRGGGVCPGLGVPFVRAPGFCHSMAVFWVRVDWVVLFGLP